MKFGNFLLSMILLLVCGSKSSASDIISANDYGARCDGIVDDTNAFQSAIRESVSKRAQLTFHGQCKISTMTLPDNAGSFSLDGHGNTLIFSSGGLVIRNSGKSEATLYDVRNLKIISQNNRKDTSITIDENVKGKIDNISVDGFNKGVLIRNSSDNRISNSFFRSFGDSYAIYIMGTLDGGGGAKTFSSNNDINNVTDIYGTGVYIGAAVQGTKIRNLRVFESWRRGMAFMR